MFRHTFREFDEDPFFSGFSSRHEDFSRLFEDRFSLIPAIEGGRREGRPRREEHALERQRDDSRRDIAPQNLFGDVFTHMNTMVESMHRGFADIERRMDTLDNDPNGYSYSHSMVSSYRNDGSGEPKYYQAAKSTSRAPGGVKHTRKALRDSESGEHKMAIGRHIGERGHVMERRENMRTNDKEEHQNYIGIDETEHGAFQKEWAEKAGHLIGPRSLDDRRYKDRNEKQHKTLEEPRPHAAHGGKRPPRKAIDYKPTESEHREDKHDKARKATGYRESRHDKKGSRLRDQ